MSALRSSAGPAVCTNGAPSSAAMMWASEVLPSPGGPASRTWSSDSSRPLAASMKTSSWAVTCSWLTKSASRRGRSERSSSSSPPEPGLGDRVGGDRVVDPAGEARVPGDAHAASLVPARAQRGPDQLLGGLAARALEQLLGLDQGVAEVHEPVAGERARVVVGAGCERRHALLELAGDLLAQLDDHPLGGPLADPGHGLEALRVAGGDRAQQLAGRAAREDRDRDLGADPRDRGQVAEQVALLLGGEAVELDRVVAGDQVGVQDRLLAARRHRLQRLGRDRQPVADPAGLDHDVVGRGGPGPRRGPRRSSDAHRRPARPTRPPPPCARGPAWQIATASASAAWSDSGGLAQPEQRPDHLLDLALGRRARCRRPPSSPPAACSRSRGSGAGRRRASRPRAPGRRRSPSARSCRSRGPRARPRLGSCQAISCSSSAWMRASRVSGGVVGRRLDHAAVDGGHLAARDPDDAETGVRHARVYAHDEDHAY